ncbi:MAG: TerB family tellurite resistance protein [Pseudomonadota bacterium]
MEAIGGLIVIVIGWTLFRLALSAGARTVGAAGRAAMGKGSFSDNMSAAFTEMGAFEVKMFDTHLNEDGSGPILKAIEGKGLFPIQHNTNIGFITSVFDETSGDFEPVICALDTFQEEGSTVYRVQNEMGIIEPNQGFVSWVRLGVVIPDILEPPYSGKRKIAALIRMVDMDNIPNIVHGFHNEGEEGILWQHVFNFEYEFEEKGYQEASEHRDESIELALKIGMAVAMSDGSLDDSEGDVLKHWTIKSIAHFSDEKQARLKKLYNDAMRESYADAKSGDLSLSALTGRLNDIGDKSVKYEALELCFEVMAADGVADEAELTIIRKIAQSLDLDMDEVAKMRDSSIVNLNANVSDHASIEIMLGIEDHWTTDEIKKHLRAEFQKWNNRLNTLTEGDERDNAQRMLDTIAEARKKYA